MDASVRQIPGQSHQLRLALVLNGGVSLAIYMYGVTKELHNLARASAARDAGRPRPEGVEGVYYDFLATASKDNAPISVSIDLIAGTSAGGINGVVLAKALATDLSIDPLKLVWFDEGDIGRLILPDTSGQQLPGWAKRVWGALGKALDPILAAGNGLLDVVTNHSPLHGSNMVRWIFAALSDMDGKPLSPALPLVPMGETLELLVTTTDMTGYRRDIVDPDTGFLPPDTTFRQVFSFLHRSDSDPSPEGGLRLATGTDVNARLTFAARATSSFPGAFPPVSIRLFAEQLAKRASLDPDEFGTAFKDAGFPAYRAAAADPMPREFIDGGVLDNTPFDVVIKSIAAKESATQVTRHIVYVQPVPADDPPTASARAGHEKWAPRTGIVGTLYHALISIPRSTSMLADLQRLQNLNVSIQTVGKLLSLLDDKAAERSSAASDDLPADPTYTALRELDERRDVVRAVGRRLRFPEDSNPMIGIEEELAAHDFSSCEFAFARRLRQVAMQAVNQQLRSAADLDTRKKLAQVKQLLYASLNELAAALEAALVAVPALPASAWANTPQDPLTPWIRPAGLPGSVWSQITEQACEASRAIESSSSLVERIQQVFGSRDGAAATAGPSASCDTIVGRIEQFLSYDRETLPVTSLAGLPQLSPIKTSRFSPADVETLDAGHKLKGLRLGHFGGFFDRKWRKEDYLWGRLTAAEQVIRLIASLTYPQGPIDDPAPEVQSAIRSALKAVFEEEPDLADLSGADIDRARELAGDVQVATGA